MADASAVMTEAAAVRKRVARPRLSANGVTLGIALAWIAIVVVAAILPRLFASGDPTVLAPARALQAPGQGTLLGTDLYGRDIVTLLAYGARSSLVIGLVATLLGAAVGGFLGLLSGYLGGWVDMLIGRIVDMLMCFPGILMALIIASALGASTRNLIIAVAIGLVPGFTRLMRGQVLTVRGRLYVEAARSVGFSPMRVLLRHILPNSLAPIVVLGTVSVGTSIVVAASLSFLGLGPRLEIPDWGQLLSIGQPYIGTAWWISTFPGLALTLTVIAVSLAGDWLRDRFDSD